MLSRQTLSSKIALFGLFALLVFLGSIKFKQWENQQKIQAEKQNIQAQTDSLQKKNDELSQSLQYLNSPGFKERVARQQLNLKKEGEIIYNFGEPKASDNAEHKAAPSNAEKWWSYFFALQ